MAKIKNDFIFIIETFLNNNFYYLSQKYFIYRVIVDVFEQISEKVESLINELIKKIIDEKNRDDLLQKIYFKKSEDLKERIDNFLQNNEIYSTNNIGENNVSSITRISYPDSYLSSGKPAPVA